MNVRMVVTGQTPDGKSVFVSDKEVPPITLSLVPGMESHRLWGADEPPSLPSDGLPTEQPAFFPPDGGYRLVFTTLPPQGAGELPADIDIEKGLAEFEEKVPGMAGHMEPDNPGMHTTHSIDFDIVLSGEVWLELDDGAEVHLKAGDVIVQNGTRHRWTNKGDLPVTFASVIVGLKRN